MGARVDIGTDGNGAPVEVDLEELLATRLLVQGNSGSGKSHLLRRLLEGSASQVQQIVIDPEGDFVSLGDVFGHVAIEASAYSSDEIARMAEGIGEHRASVVLSLEGLELEPQARPTSRARVGRHGGSPARPNPRCRRARRRCRQAKNRRKR